MSYHNVISRLAKKVEEERSSIYHVPGEDSKLVTWSPRELGLIYGALYKLLRILLSTKDIDKAMDDLIDVYNFCALLFEEVSCRIGRGSVVKTSLGEQGSKEKSKENWKKMDTWLPEREPHLDYTILSPSELEMIGLKSD